MNKEERATFAGGCFWCTEQVFDNQPGILSTRVGYTGGHLPNPTYEQVCSGTTGHVEALELSYDPTQISYRTLLDLYWDSIQPERQEGQFCDVGPQYRPVIFTHTEDQRKIAEAYLQQRRDEGIPVAVALRPAAPFYPAEDYHQRYYKKDPLRYRFYKDNSGR